MADAKKALRKAFGEVLLELRTNKGMTQEGLALDAGTERSHISALERGEKGPSLGTVLGLAQALGISAELLVGRLEKKLAEKKR